MPAIMAKKKPKDEAADRHRHKVIGVRPPEDLRIVLEDLATKDRRPVATMCVILLEEALQARGLWPTSDVEGDR